MGERCRCTACGSTFELNDEARRCPTCLRKSTVRTESEGAAASATRERENSRRELPTRVVVTCIVLALDAFALGASWLAIQQAMLLGSSYELAGEVVESHLASTRVATCSVTYRYVVDGTTYTQSASVLPPCPIGRVVARVSRLDPSTSDLGAGVSLTALFVAPLAVFAAFAASVVALQLWFPRSARLRRWADAVGSRWTQR